MSENKYNVMINCDWDTLGVVNGEWEVIFGEALTTDDKVWFTTFASIRRPRSIPFAGATMYNPFAGATMYNPKDTFTKKTARYWALRRAIATMLMFESEITGQTFSKDAMCDVRRQFYNQTGVTKHE